MSNPHTRHYTPYPRRVFFRIRKNGRADGSQWSDYRQLSSCAIGVSEWRWWPKTCRRTPSRLAGRAHGPYVFYSTSPPGQRVQPLKRAALTSRAATGIPLKRTPTTLRLYGNATHSTTSYNSPRAGRTCASGSRSRMCGTSQRARPRASCGSPSSSRMYVLLAPALPS